MAGARGVRRVTPSRTVDDGAKQRSPEPELPRPTGQTVKALAEGWLDSTGLLQLQEASGNKAVSRMLTPTNSPELARAALMRDDTLPSADEYHEARDKRNEWVADGFRGPENYRASTGLGGFEVSYGPNLQELFITLNGAVNFQDGIELFMGVSAFANQPTAPVQAAAQAINQLPLAQRAAAIAPWQWGSDKAQFLKDFQSAVESAWGERYEFHCTKKYWEDLGAKVKVDVNVHEGDKGDDDHMKLTTYKIAPNAPAGNVGVVNSGRAGFFDNGSQNNTMTINSNDVGQRSDIQLTTNAAFDAGATTMDAANTAKVQRFGGDYKSSGGPRCATCSKEIAGLAGTTIHCKIQGSGADPEANARQRLATVTAALSAGGMTMAPNYEYAGTGEGVTLVVGEGVQQVVAAHEAGHMFGLSDEYTSPFSGTGKAPGSPVDANLGPGQGLPGAIAENTDSIMAVGAAVKPQHYATFLEALKDVTGMSEWALGPAQGVLPPAADGPLPQPPAQPGAPPPEPAPAMA